MSEIEKDMFSPNMDTVAQREIARHLSPLYWHIDLTIPAQRQVADSVRVDFGLPPLRALKPRAGVTPSESSLRADDFAIDEVTGMTKEDMEFFAQDDCDPTDGLNGEIYEDNREF